MRVSTNMIYDKGVMALQNQTAALLKTQQQVSTGRRVLTPADDPIASARALELGQSRSVNQQFGVNIGYANDNLKLLEGKLTGVGDILQYTRERAVQAGNATNTDEDLGYIATDLKSQFQALLGIANTQDGQGDYLFSGYMANTKPFEGAFGNVSYQGDQGGRTIQVSASRFMPTSLPGSDIFDRNRVIDVAEVRVPTDDKPTTNDALYSYRGVGNAGTASAPQVSFTNIALDPSDPDSPRNPDNQGRRYVITYTQADRTVPENVVVDPLAPADLGGWTIEEVIPGVGRQAVTVTAPVLPDLADPNFALVSFNGIQVRLPLDQPAPANPNQEDTSAVVSGDAFEVFVASTNMFQNYALAVNAMEDSAGFGPDGAGRVGPIGGVAFALENLDAALENVLKVRAQVGSQMVETEQLTNLGEDLNLQYAEAISRLEDVDYNEAISRLTQQQTYLQAAQQSFLRVTGLSLFNFIS